jgi:hypothetical protein
VKDTGPKAHVLHRRPNAVLTATTMHPLDPRNRKTKYAVTVNGKSICGYTMGNAKGRMGRGQPLALLPGRKLEQPEKGDNVIARLCAACVSSGLRHAKDACETKKLEKEF